MKDNVIYWLWFLHALNGRKSKLSKVHRHFGSIEAIYRADREQYMSVAGLKDNDIDGLCNKSTDNADNSLRFCISKGIDIIPYDSDKYPQQLKEIDDYPCVLFATGEYTEAISKPCITIVGTRDCTQYGRTSTRNLAYSLTKAGFSIVTGVAEGIDTAAIEGVTAAGGKPITVLPGGHTRAQYNSSFKVNEMSSGAVALSEHAPGAPTQKFSYHERNRLLSGLSYGTVVTQAPKSSGALITASHAVNQNRDVFALIANSDMLQSEGSNLLIRDGAIPLIDYVDVLEFYRIKLGDALNYDIDIDPMFSFRPESKDLEEFKLNEFRRVAKQHLTFEEMRVFDTIGINDTDIDTIISDTDLPVSTVMSTLSSLESSGLIVSIPGNKYKIVL